MGNVGDLQFDWFDIEVDEIVDDDWFDIEVDEVVDDV